jgi:hypothetical protein
MRNEIGFQGTFIVDTKQAIVVLSVTKGIYFSLLARYQALELQSPRRNIEYLLHDTNKGLVSMTAFGTISSHRFSRILMSKMYEALELTARNGAYPELRQILVQLSSFLNAENVRFRVQEINRRLIKKHVNYVEETHYLQWTV